MTAVARKQHVVGPTPHREQVLARYRALRSISRRHNSNAMKFLSPGSILHHARRLGLADGRTILLDSEDEMSFVFDLAIYTSPSGRTKAIDRYARSVRLAADSDEALMLEAMCKAKFAILHVERRHETTGLIVEDMVRDERLWLVDEGLEASMPNESILATRLYQPSDFAMTAGVMVPLDSLFPPEAFFGDALLFGKPLSQAIEGRQFAEKLYLIALGNGWATRSRLQDVGEEPAHCRDDLTR